MIPEDCIEPGPCKPWYQDVPVESRGPQIQSLEQQCLNPKGVMVHTCGLLLTSAPRNTVAVWHFPSCPETRHGAH